MLKTILNTLTSAVLLFPLLVSNAYTNEIRLHIPTLSEDPQHHVFFHNLLEQAITEAGYTPKLIIADDLPQRRIVKYLEVGRLSIFWLIESEERNKKFIPIDVGITNGLIGKRILLIKKGDQYLYNDVKTLEDFRNLNLVGGFGEKWFEAKIWKMNNLLVHEHSGRWELIFKMLGKGRQYDYFALGINAVLDSAKQHPELDVEQRLALIYDRDFRFYLSKTGVNAGAKYKEELLQILTKAKNSGLIEREVEKYWGDDFRKLNYSERVKIHLKTPH
ncbi:MAG: hypothetical protein MI864_22150 [Pseudomonadales bacterium]|nr:hypothetical protein [Pseudomonadales bacterium]